MKNRKLLNSCLLSFALLTNLALLPSLAFSQNETQDHFKTLGVSPAASDAEIKIAFRRMAAKFHPDKWSQATADEVKKAQDSFIRVRHAFEVLSDPEQRSTYNSQRGYAVNEAPSSSLPLALKELDLAKTPSEIADSLQKLASLRSAIYKNSEAHHDTEASKQLKEIVSRKIQQGSFDHLPSALGLIELTANWTYFEGENEFRQTLNWDSLHLEILNRWLDQGLSLHQALEHLKSLTLQVDIKLAMSFNNQNSLKSQPSPFYLTGEMADGLLRHQLENGKIKTSQQFSEVIAALVDASGPNGYQRPLFSAAGLAGMTKHILPFLSEMSAPQVQNWARLTTSNPIESLGLLQALLSRSAGALTPEDLLKTMKVVIDGTLDHYLKESRTFTQGSTIEAYMSAHPQYDKNTLQNWVNQEIQEANKRNVLFTPDRGHERFLYQVIKKDLLHLIIKNKKTLNQSGFENHHWDQLKTALNVSSLEFSTKSMLSFWPQKPSVDWVKATQQLRFSTTKLKAPICSKIFLP